MARNKRKTAQAAKKPSGAETAAANKKAWQDLLFHPLIYKASESAINFETVIVPFAIEGGLVSALSLSNSIGDTAIYMESFDVGMKSPEASYRDGLQIMQACRQMEKRVRAEYYFGKLDKSIDNYLYALSLLTRTGFLTEDAAMGLANAVGMSEADIATATKTVIRNLYRARQAFRNIGAPIEQDPAMAQIAEIFADIAAELWPKAGESGDGE